MTNTKHELIVEKPCPEKNIGGETRILINVNDNNFQKMKQHDGKIANRRIAERDCDENPKQTKASALSISDLDALSFSYSSKSNKSEETLWKKIGNVLYAFWSFSTQEKNHYVRKEDVEKEIKYIAEKSLDPNKQQILKEITAELNDRVVQAPENLVFSNPINQAKLLLADGRHGIENHDVVDAFDKNELNRLLKFTSDPVEKLKFIGMLFEHVVKNAEKEYTYTGYLRFFNPLLIAPLTTTQKNHIAILKSGCIDILNAHCDDDSVAKYFSSMLNKDNIVDFNTAAIFKKEITNTRRMANLIIRHRKPLESLSFSDPVGSLALSGKVGCRR